MFLYPPLIVFSYQAVLHAPTKKLGFGDASQKMPAYIGLYAYLKLE